MQTDYMKQEELSINAKILDILYRQVAPERILGKISDQFWNPRTFLDYAETRFGGYSENEQKLIYTGFVQKCRDWKKGGLTDIDNVFLPLLSFSDNVLKISGNDIVCRSDYTLLWREAFLNLGQDLFTCAYLALYDHKHAIDRKQFIWPICIHTDNSNLYHMIKKGLAENHNHLKGGTQSFTITWCRFMNYPEYLQEDIHDFMKHESNLLSKISRGDGCTLLALKQRIELASLIRSILFRSMECHSDSYALFREEYTETFSYSNNLYRTIEALRSNYGAKLYFPDNSSFCLDYALKPSLMKYCVRSDIRIMTGERSFMYNCFRACLRKDGFNSFEQRLFYLYLVLKSNFRSEMIQNNGQVGFRNFANYQERKDGAWDNNSYFWEAAKIAINYRLNNESIDFLEARLVPKPLRDENIKRVIRFDKAKFFADCHPSTKIIDRSEYDFNTELQLQKYRGLNWFYVFHFGKGYNWPDQQKHDGFIQTVSCRNYEQRMNARLCACAMMEALHDSSYLRCRVRGIDAASDEFRCRPEVFAQVYRYITEEQNHMNMSDTGFFPSAAVCIGKTYHVGEDFPDIADGLRAIDEAIEFLELDQGSRLGHCLALGVEPEVHYRTKNYEVVTTKQDRLDDLIWILFRSCELGVSIDSAFETQLKREAWILMDYIYGDCYIDGSKWHGDMKEYRCSMHLRADAPECYRTGEYENFWSVERIDRYRLGKSIPELRQYREDKDISALYYFYHFADSARKKGDETYSFRVSREYILLMRQLQDAMIGLVRNHGIVIECNPSSNVLIGTFGTYGKHPIFRFNDRKLSRKKPDQKSQLQVCINTDDLGVFDTSLEFEYVLLYQALKEKTDDSGAPLYEEQDIIDYLDDIREIGRKAVFPENEETAI